MAQFVRWPTDIAKAADKSQFVDRVRGRSNYVGSAQCCGRFRWPVGPKGWQIPLYCPSRGI